MKKSALIKIAAAMIVAVVCTNPLFAKKKSKVEAKKVDAPKWLTDEGRRQVFPEEEFISAKGYGSTESDAQKKAAAQLSYFIKTKIVAATEAHYEAREKNGFVTKERSVVEDNSVTSEATLYSVESTTPFYDSERGSFAAAQELIGAMMQIGAAVASIK